MAVNPFLKPIFCDYPTTIQTFYSGFKKKYTVLFHYEIKYSIVPLRNSTVLFHSVLRIRIRIRMNPHDFGLLAPHPESAFQMRIPNADSKC